jgi:hypothetical protein
VITKPPDLVVRDIGIVAAQPRNVVRLNWVVKPNWGHDLQRGIGRVRVCVCVGGYEFGFQR